MQTPPRLQFLNSSSMQLHRINQIPRHQIKRHLPTCYADVNFPSLCLRASQTGGCEALSQSGTLPGRHSHLKPSPHLI
jgi:hypothetical protein